MNTTYTAGQHTLDFEKVYPLKTRLSYTAGAIMLAILIAGFWNYHLVDGFGKDIVAGNTIGDTSHLAGQFNARGSGFGFVFAAIAGLAATFTACNCVVFAMIPGLACAADQTGSKKSAYKALGSFVLGVLIITACYGVFVGLLGKKGVETINSQSVRLAQAQAIFTILGLVMLIWGVIEMGYLNTIKQRFTDITRAFFAQATTKALLLGALVGAFAVGRPFPVFRQFLEYAASAHNPLYGAAVMMVQGLGQIAVMAFIFFLIVKIAGNKISRTATEKPYKFRMISSMALITGGTYFIYYWGLAFLFDIGRWGFKLGWYG